MTPDRLQILERQLIDREIKNALPAVEAIRQENLSLIELVTRPEVMETTQWNAAVKRPGSGQNHEWDRMYAGIGAVGQREVLKGSNGEYLDSDSRFDNGNHSSPSSFWVRGGNDQGLSYSLSYRDDKGHDSATMDWSVSTENAHWIAGIRTWDGEKVGLSLLSVQFRGFWIKFSNPGIMIPEGEISLDPEKAKIKDSNGFDLNLSINKLSSWYVSKHPEVNPQDIRRWIVGIPNIIRVGEMLEEIARQNREVVKALKATAENPSVGKIVPAR